MMGRFTGLLLALVLITMGSARAQTFAPASGVSNENTAHKVSTEMKVGEPVNRPVAAVASSDQEAEDVGLLNTVEKNLQGGKEIEKEYDNSMGKVVHFRIENGKVVFDNDRKILVYYEDYKVERGLDAIVRCSMRVYVLNDLQERISNIGFKLKWPEISTNIQMSRVNPGVRTYMDVMLLGNGCLTMDKAPTIEVNRCRVKGMSDEKCADAIRWFKKNQ